MSFVGPSCNTGADNANNNNHNYPDAIIMKGLPFMLQGWNNVYYKSGEYSEGAPVYRMESYILYGFIPIIGVLIFKHKGKWVFQRECDPEPTTEIFKLIAKSELPFGKWNGSARVTTIFNEKSLTESLLDIKNPFYIGFALGVFCVKFYLSINK